MEIPPHLKTVKAYIKRAEELDRDPRDDRKIVAYFCRLYAIQLAMPEINKDPSGASKRFAVQLMTRLEEDKAGVAGGISPAEGQEHVSRMALGVFKKADDEDRAGMASRGTAQKFYFAANFMMVLKQFGPLDPKIEEMCKYAQFKAADIDRCIKNGVTPTPGPPGGEEGDSGEVVMAEPTPTLPSTPVAPAAPDAFNPFGLPDVPPELPKTITPPKAKGADRGLSLKESELEREARELAARMANVNDPLQPQPQAAPVHSNVINFGGPVLPGYASVASFPSGPIYTAQAIEPPDAPDAPPLYPPNTHPWVPPPSSAAPKPPAGSASGSVGPKGKQPPPSSSHGHGHSSNTPPAPVYRGPASAIEDAHELTMFGLRATEPHPTPANAMQAALKALDKNRPNPALALQYLKQAVAILEKVV